MEFPSFEAVVSWFKGVIPAIKLVWQNLNGPYIGAKLLDTVGYDFYLEIRNVGGGSAAPRVFLADLTDGRDRFTGKVTSPVEIYERDTLGLSLLSGRARSVFAILSVEWKNRPAMYVRANNVVIENGERRKTHGFYVIDGVPLHELKEIRLTYRIVFYTADGQRELKDEIVQFSLLPDVASEKFTLRPIRPPHMTLDTAERLGLRGHGQDCWRNPPMT